MALLVVAFVLHALLLNCGSEPCEENGLEEKAPSLWYWILDPARFVIFVVSLLLITLGSRRAVYLDRNCTEAEAEGVYTLSSWHVALLPIFGSVMLIIFYYFFDFIQFIFTIITTSVSLIAMYNLLYPTVESVQVYCKDINMASSQWLQRAVTLLLASAIAGLWIITGHWLYLDILGGSLCVLMIQFLRVPNLKLSTFLLVALLAYDVFWVFCSSSIFDQNVMVAVATKKAQNPVAVVAQKLNLPEVAKSQPPLSIPGKLLVPSLADHRAFAMLGLGDIVLPGLLLCFAMRFDSLCQSTGGGTTISSVSVTRLRMLFQRWSYFSIALCGYAVGLIVASIVVDLTGAAQPALLYLVPSTLIPILLKAIIQGDFSTMWTGPHFVTRTKPYQNVGKALPF
jgi:signal peptide peptidase-like protein 3